MLLFAFVAITPPGRLRNQAYPGVLCSTFLTINKTPELLGTQGRDTWSEKETTAQVLLRKCRTPSAHRRRRMPWARWKWSGEPRSQPLVREVISGSMGAGDNRPGFHYLYMMGGWTGSYWVGQNVCYLFPHRMALLGLNGLELHSNKFY